MGASPSSDNRKARLKRHKKNVETYLAAVEKREAAVATKAAPKQATPKKPKAAKAKAE